MNKQTNSQQAAFLSYLVYIQNEKTGQFGGYDEGVQ